MSRKIIFIGLILLSFAAQADHWTGGHIAYKSLGQNANGYLYEVKLYLIRDMAGIAVGNTAKIYYGSSCFGLDSVEFNLDPDVLPASDYSCVDRRTGGEYKAYSYTGTILLPTMCSDWKFSFRGCCRSMQLSNILNPQNSGIYLESTLNNTLGPNNSAEFASLRTKTFCFNPQFPVDWEHPAEDSDGDSLYFRLATPMENDSTNLNYAAGFSYSQPFSSQPALIFDPRNATMTFRPTDIELDILRIVVEEYRYDVGAARWQMCGSSSKEIQVPIVPYCADEVVFWELSSRADTISEDYYYYCGDSSLYFFTSQNFRPESVAADASDFKLIEGNREILLKSVEIVSDSSLLIHMADTMARQDTFYLVVQYGTDNSTLINLCGYRMIPNDSLRILHMGCAGMTQTEKPEERFAVYPNPTRHKVQIELPSRSSLQWRCYNSAGYLVKQGQFPRLKATELDFSSLPDGLYLLEIITDKNRFTTYISKS